MKNLTWRAVLVLVVIVSSLLLLAPTINPKLPAWWSKWGKIHLGLDLQGGVHLVLEVDTEKALQTSAERFAEDLKAMLREQKVPFLKVERTQNANIRVTLASADAQTELTKVVEKNLPIFKTGMGETAGEGVSVQLNMIDAEAQHIRKMAVSQALETIRNRIDQYGVTEPDIRLQGEDRILIQLPGVKDPQEAIELVKKTGQLEFKLVAEGLSPDMAKEGKLPPDTRLYPHKIGEPGKGQRTEQIVLKDRTLLTGQYITKAEHQIDSQNKAYVSLEFDPTGGKIFERVTGENVKKQLAIVLDGTVYSAPEIREKISGGKASITGHFTDQEARFLAIVLRAGALPAPVKVLEQRAVGPSLGKDSIDKGLLASLLGGIVTIAFMLIYYRMSGMIADLALVLNIPLILAAMAALNATLTLPGIAGIILSVGMAVDANVLIFERIREELRLGKSPRAALETGYDRATLTILDSNVTTFIAALVLFQFGTGPVRGFAVTLSIGIAASMFTAIIVTRVIFDYLLLQRRVKTLSI